MGNYLEALKRYVSNRRNKKHPDPHSQPNHPENDHTTADVSSNGCSEFYWACRNNEFEKVKRLLKNMKLNEVDKLEPNGSTALHAACFQGHKDVVELLLRAGADRAIQNKYKNLPFDEAKTEEIKQLFFRVPNSNRLVSDTGAIEWELINKTVLETATEERNLIKSVYDNNSGVTPIDKMFEKIEKNYINEGLTNFDGIDDIKRFFEKATKEQDPIWIIKAYTAETDFYKILNKEIAGGANKYQNERRYIIALLMYHPKLDSLSFTGTCYRVIQINNDNLKRYQIGCSLMIKSFVSSSIDKKITEWFLNQQQSSSKQNNERAITKLDGTLIKSWIMCIYHIKHRRTAVNIEESSQYANEGEILIMPYTVFKVKKIQRTAPSYFSGGQSMTEIELEECD
jgi:hypothetical protein